MDNDDEQRERLDMDNDYEGGVEIGGEFFYTAKRQKRRQTKDEQLYGVFNEGSSDEEEERRRRGKKPAADYTRPVSFVSTGIGMGSAEHPAPTTATEMAAAAPADTNGAGSSAGGGLGFGRAPGGGLGFTSGGSTAGGLGFTGGNGAGLGSEGRAGLGGGGGGGGGLGPTGSAGAGLGSEGRAGLGGGGGGGFRSAGIGSSGAADMEEDHGEVILPSAFGRQILNEAERRKREQKQKVVAEKKRVAVVKDGIGEFESYTKGVASKMMEKMGYVRGQGLGRAKQGIAKPVEARLRGKGVGLGFGERGKPEPTPVAPQPSAAQAEADVPVQLWKKRHAAQRVRREYKTAAEVLEAGQRDGGAAAMPAATAILDMRGPQARVVTNMEHLNQQEETEAGAEVPMPELQHNLRLLVDLAEADIQKLDARLRHQQDTAVVLAREKERLDDLAAEAAAAAQSLSEVYAAVEHCGGADVPPSEQLAAYTQLQRRYPEEYVMYNLPAAALAEVLPRLRAAMAAWQPLQQPAAWADEFAGWRPLLENPGTRDAIFLDTAAAGDAYYTLVSATVLPRVQQAISTGWQAREPEPLLSLLDAWERLLPPALHRHILDALIYPKLAAAVEEWEPRRERVPLHAWLHPWLPALGDQLRQVYPGVRHKLASALTAWHPADRSALALLAPWQRVFDAKSWGALMSRSILPKLGAGLATLQINPAHQPPESLAPWHDAMAWAPSLGPGQAAGLLDAAFWPQWHGVLGHWLANGPDMDQVVAWFSGWKALLSQDLRDDERVRAQLNAALNAMHGAGSAAGAQPQADYCAAAPQPDAAADGAAAGGRWAEEENFTLRQLVEDFAAEHEVAFLPKPGRTEGGLQVWGFGGVSIIMETKRQLIRAHVGDRWAPMSLEELLQEQRKRAAGCAAA